MLTTWPICPTCNEPLWVTVGLPVTITRASSEGRLVSYDVDISDAADFDEDDHIGCGCGTPNHTPELIEALGQVLDEANEAQGGSAEAIANR